MLRNMKDLQGIAIRATDGLVGHVADFYFDDEAWVIRYLIIDTGTCVSTRKVLIPPIAIRQTSWSDGTLSVEIGKQEVRNAPGVGIDAPVSRQSELEHFGY
jgi:hypothetical protein